MRIIIEIAPDTVDHGHTGEAISEAQEVVRTLNAAADRRKDQGLPGMLWERGDATVWVASARLDFE